MWTDTFAVSLLEGRGESLRTPLTDLTTDLKTSVFRWRASFILQMIGTRLGVGPLIGSLLDREQRVARNCMKVHEVISRTYGAGIIVDSSKEADHFLRIFSLFPDLVLPVFLIRDGRGIVWSKMKRGSRDVRQATLSYMWQARLQRFARRSVPSRFRSYVYYEELCRNPEQVEARILDPLDIPMRTIDLSLLSTDRHDLGGSPRFKTSTSRSIQVDEPILGKGSV